MTFELIVTFSDNGGGGERVLWEMIQTVLDCSDRDIVIYSGDIGVSKERIINNVKVISYLIYMTTNNHLC